MKFVRIIGLALLVGCCCGLLVAQAPPLTLEREAIPSQLNAGVEFHIIFHAKGGIPPYVWTLADGDLPDGLTLTRDGFLSGRPARPGTFMFTLRVEDSGQPAHSLTNSFQVDVVAPLLLEWHASPKVHDDRIDGSVQVSNGSKDPFDLTVVIVAVADNGRATAIGYQHFELKAGSTNVQIPFGSTLPYGGYTIHADAIAEIPSHHTILRQRLQTPQPLQVLQGP